MRKWLKSIREERGISQYAAAELCGISQSYYGAVEVGTRNVPVHTAKKIASVFGFSWQKFFEDEQTSGQSQA